MAELTLLLNAAAAGDAPAREQLMALMYGELKRLARSRLRRSAELTLLDSTSLVHEAWLRFGELQGGSFPDRRYFLAYAAKVMRHVVIDALRARDAERRGGGAEHVEIDTMVVDNLPASSEQVLQVHEALDHIAALEPRLAQVVEMRFFGGLSEAEIAESLGMTERTVQRDWRKARLLLAGMLG